MKARPKAEWHEDMGPVLWWKFPITEAPYVGSPLDLGYPVEVKFTTNTRKECGTIRRYICGWPGYHTHFTTIETPTKP